MILSLFLQPEKLYDQCATKSPTKRCLVTNRRAKLFGNDGKGLFPTVVMPAR
jgi:hypothetical protein